MIKILICEDDLKDRKILIEYLRSYFKRNKIDIEIDILNNYESSDLNIPKWRSHLIRQNRATYSNLENHLIQITEPGNPI